MNTKVLIPFLCLLLSLISCSKNIEYSQEFKAQTAGRYLYNEDEVIDVYYEDNIMYMKWKGAERLKPLAVDSNAFFLDDMYEKLRFVQHPETKERYLSIIPKDNESKITYDYLKVEDSFKTPRMHLKDKEYKKAFEGYLAIKEKDSSSIFVDESEFNQLGYELLRKKEYDKAIEVFKMNVALYPESDNVYDSLGDGYLRSGDSLNAYNNYKKALELYNGNRKAKKYIEAYEVMYN